MPSNRRRPRHGRPLPTFALPTMSSTALPSTSKSTLHAVKICGVVSAADVEMVIEVARPILPPNVELLIGSILWPKSPRAVDGEQARAISAAAIANGAKPVAVFLDEDVATMEAACKKTGFTVAQLHGPPCRQSMRDIGGHFPSGLPWIDVRDVDSDGATIREEDTIGDPLYCIFDSKGGGTGKAFDWSRFHRPDGPWLLAGGLSPDNIGDAVAALRPYGVDVATGVAKGDRRRKDEHKLRIFVERLVQAYS